MLIEKSRSGVYQDTSENRRLHRVGQRYGEQKQPEEKKGSDSVRDVEIVTSKQGIKVFLNGKVGGDYYKAVAEAYKALKKSGKSKSVDAMLKESGSGSPSKDVPAKKYVEAVNDGASHDEAVAFANDCYEELLAKIKNVQEKVYSEGISQSVSDKMFAAVNKWFNAQKFEKQAASEPESKAPTSVRIEEKTFHVKDGKINASMYDKQSRISKLMKFAKEHGYEIAWEESEKKESTLADKMKEAGFKQTNEGYEKSNGAITVSVKKLASGYYIGANDGKPKTLVPTQAHFSGDAFEKMLAAVDKRLGLDKASVKQIELPKGKNVEKILAAINGDEFAMKKLSRNDVLGEVRVLETRRKDVGIVNADPDRFKSADKNTLLVRFKELYNDTVSYNKTGVSSLAVAEQAAAKKQAEEVDRGVRAAEEKRNLEEIKRTNEKMNAAMKEQFNADKKSVKTSEKPTSRVTFVDVPHAKDVNLKKYLTDSRRKDVDRLMQAMDGMPKTAVKHAHDAAVAKFNDNFDSMKKSERASALYVIMKYKDLMNKAK